MLVSFGTATDAGDLRRRLRPLRVRSSDRTRGRSSSAARGRPRSRRSRSTRACRAGSSPPTGDEPNGFTSIHQGAPEADVNVLDMPVLASLLFQNTPTGRLIEDFNQFDLYEDLPPLSTETSMATGEPELRRERRVRQGVRAAAPAWARAAAAGRLDALRDVRRAAARDRSPRRRRLDGEQAPPLAARRDGVLARRVRAPGVPAAVLRQPLRACHGAVSGRPVDNAVAPDILTQASDTLRTARRRSSCACRRASGRRRLVRRRIPDSDERARSGDQRLCRGDRAPC